MYNLNLSAAHSLLTILWWLWFNCYFFPWCAEH